MTKKVKKISQKKFFFNYYFIPLRNNHSKKGPMMKRHVKTILSIAMGAAMIASCTQVNDNNAKSQKDSMSQTQKQAFNQAKAVFYAMPSPVETATTLERLNVKFTDKYLHKTSDAPKYNTTTSEAVNLGIYIADLSFCALYEQNQAVIDYLATVKKLSEQLGIASFFNDSTIQTFHDNINNKNKIISAISDSYSKSTTFLDEQERAEIASTVIVGGWIETLHLTLSLLRDVDLKKDQSEVNDIMLSQQFTLEDLMGMLYLFNDDKYISQLTEKLKGLKTSFDRFNGEITIEQIDAIEKNVLEIRNNFIQ